MYQNYTVNHTNHLVNLNEASLLKLARFNLDMLLQYPH